MNQQQSFQLFNLQLDRNKTLQNSLSQIFGISVSMSQQICIKFGFNQKSVLREVNLDILTEIRKYILLEYSIQGILQKKIKNNIQDLISMKSVKGFRHKLNLPVRGQRTRSNHKTQKKRNNNS